ncbi:TonB-dependent receptor [Pseudomonas guariconensis]|uniref:TonB-dependent receptor family protein n=1 Tax=Pseudomonas TaxID=286 RepID=UPI0020980343|nr:MULTISPECIES: TonB-dependent receptor [Pseudomonas]MCO7640237.1 TonB-dependent receptor [Pseudomonas sp. S 311-6]MCO7515967.1 TonB-dependent receptor [Pseudomonas putida]MCO7565571.1 TonB-dependent receptor [Pseudomonas mosselii]MCO7606434.1 TonB-dependent receptor [Pseudomonas guariconensis]MCO7617679.1 TonB-dependent receptor [Pseudomonas guariconensis]
MRAKVRPGSYHLSVFLALFSPVALAATESTLQTVTVTGAAASGAQQDQKRLQNVAGNTAVVDNRQVEQGRAANAEDVLALQPGVFAQGTSGTAANKISIRGSGLNTFYQGYVLGTKFLFDGLPITGPGGTQEDFLDMQAVDHTEVLYGANAFEYGALSLGGAINMVSKTGRTDPGNYARFEVGSYGYRKQQLATGGVVGDSDYYINVLHNERDGYQDHASNEGRGIAANFGHVFSPKLETRVFFKYREEQLVNGNTLTRQQLKHDPRSNLVPTGRRKDGTTFIGNKTTYTFDDGNTLEVGASYNNYPLLNGWRYAVAPQDWRSKDINLTLRYLRTGDRFLGLPSDSSIIFSNTRAYLADVKSHSRATGAKIQETNYTGSRDTVLTFANELQLTDDLWLSSGLSFINIRRKAEIEGTTLTTANPSDFPTRVEYVENDLAPRLGLRYQLNPDFQVFGNVSRSIDPPVTWQLGSTSNPFLYDVRPQKATTFEVGIRGSHGIFDGSLTLYRSWVKEELLTVVVRQASATQDQLTATSNASPTIHQGIEAGLNALLWAGTNGDTLDLRQAYTLNDFHYRNDDTFGDNELPSLPRQVYQAELAYRQASGFYASLNLRTATRYYIDYANTWHAPSYVLWGAKVGYQAPSKKWEVFADLRNITDERYASAANTAYDANGRDSANFYPGDAFSVTTGVAVRF